jgi:hypothetical protein
MTMMPISQMPDDIKQDIAKVADAMRYMAVGGTCHFRSVAGMFALRLAGVEAQRCIGGMIYRAGPDERSDVVAFCGPGNVGRFKDGMFMGHMWLRAGDALIDFSSGDWRGEVEAFGPLIDDGYAKLGPIQWTADPPAFFWGLWDSFMPPRINGTVWTPELGRAAYTGFHGTAEERRKLDDISPEMKPMIELLLRRQMELAKQLDIKARVAAWRTGARS